MTRAATLADVAALAGVSGKTVSRVVNRDPNVSEITRQKVEAAISAKRFRPNLSARSLASAKSYLIGSLALQVSSFYYAEFYRGAAKACRSRGYHLVIEEIACEHPGMIPPMADVYRQEMMHIPYDDCYCRRRFQMTWLCSIYWMSAACAT